VRRRTSGAGHRGKAGIEIVAERGGQRALEAGAALM
jgi:hypothetical protein